MFYSWGSQKFCGILVVNASFWHVYLMTETVQAEKYPLCLVDNTYCTDTLCMASFCLWFESHKDVNVPHSLIQKLMLCGFELQKPAKNICCATKGEGAVDHSISY